MTCLDCFKVYRRSVIRQCTLVFIRALSPHLTSTHLLTSPNRQLPLAVGPAGPQNARACVR